MKKINNYLNKLEIFLGREKLFSLPRWVQVEPTNLCNQGCVMCPRNTHLDSPLGMMTLENFKLVFKQIPTINDLQLNGLGEPFLNKDIFAMIRHAKSNGSNVTMTSNCELADPNKAKQLVESGLNILKISMDSTDATAYREIRKGNLDKAIEGIKNIVEAKKKLNSEKPLLWFNSIIMKNNFRQMLKILKLGGDLGIDYVRFKSIDTFDVYQNDNLTIPENELFEEIRKVVEMSKDWPVKHNLHTLLGNRDIYYKPKNIDCPCYSPWLEVYIQWYGGVRLCCEFYSSKYDVGNMFERSFGSIWNGSAMMGIRKSFLKGQMNFPVCKTCNRFQRNIVINNKIKSIKFWT